MKKKISNKKELTLLIIYFLTFNIFAMEEKQSQSQYYNNIIKQEEPEEYPINSKENKAQFKKRIEKLGFNLNYFYEFKNKNNEIQDKKNSFLKLWAKIDKNTFKIMPRSIVSCLLGLNGQSFSNYENIINQHTLIDKIKSIPGESLGVLEIKTIWKMKLNIELTDKQIERLPDDTVYLLYDKKNNITIPNTQKDKIQKRYNEIFNNPNKKLNNKKKINEFELLKYTGENFNGINAEILNNTNLNNIYLALPYISKEIIQEISSAQIQSMNIRHVVEILNKLLPNQLKSLATKKIPSETTIDEISKILEYGQHLDTSLLKKIKEYITTNNGFQWAYTSYNYNYKESSILLKMVEKYKNSNSTKLKEPVIFHQAFSSEAREEIINEIKQEIKKSNNENSIKRCNALLNNILSSDEKNDATIRNTIQALLNIIIKESIQQENLIQLIDENIKNTLLKNHISYQDFNNFIKKFRKYFNAVETILKIEESRNTKINEYNQKIFIKEEEDNEDEDEDEEQEANINEKESINKAYKSNTDQYNFPYHIGNNFHNMTASDLNQKKNTLYKSPYDNIFQSDQPENIIKKETEEAQQNILIPHSSQSDIFPFADLDVTSLLTENKNAEIIKKEKNN